MYIRIENREVIEVRTTYSQIHESEGNKVGFYERSNYGRPDVRPIDGTSSWQLFWKFLVGDNEICIATFDTVEDANKALNSLKFTSEDKGWDAIEFKKELPEESW